MELKFLPSSRCSVKLGVRQGASWPHSHWSASFISIGQLLYITHVWILKNQWAPFVMVSYQMVRVPLARELISIGQLLYLSDGCIPIGQRDHFYWSAALSHTCSDSYKLMSSILLVSCYICQMVGFLLAREIISIGQLLYLSDGWILVGQRDHFYWSAALSDTCLDSYKPISSISIGQLLYLTPVRIPTNQWALLVSCYNWHLFGFL